MNMKSAVCMSERSAGDRGGAAGPLEPDLPVWVSASARNALEDTICRREHGGDIADEREDTA